MKAFGSGGLLGRVKTSQPPTVRSDRARFKSPAATAVIASAKIPELSAAVSFCGLPPEQAVKAADVRVPLQGHFVNKDDHITPKAVDAFEKALKAASRAIAFLKRRLA